MKDEIIIKEKKYTKCINPTYTRVNVEKYVKYP